MADYKQTLNLPKTNFPMKANLPQKEPEILKFWQEINLYEKIRAKYDAQPKFILHDGPPYANGRPHLGTALNKILKDIVVKSKTLSGFNAPFVPGWDCHGLPIELNVEKNIGKAGQHLSKKEFRQKCREYAQTQIELQSKDFQRLGILGDWSNPYITMDFQYEADAVRALAQIISQGHLTRGQKPVHWCTVCESALAEAEVEYKEKSSPAIDVIFQVVYPSKILNIFNVAEKIPVIVPIWTTTPWTLPANQAVALNPEIHYTLVRCQWRNQMINLLLAKDLVDKSLQRYGIDDYQVHGNILGKHLEGILLQHPFLSRTVPIVLGEHVTTETGTGCVHTAPAHGIEDYLVGERYGLPLENPVNEHSVFVEGIPLVSGVKVFAANDIITTALADSGHLLHLQKLQHSYPHCWRHKTPLIFRATSQWFISMDKANLRGQALQVIKNVKWQPIWGEARITGMVADRPDWCISRQRTWGIPIALFIHKKTSELHPRTQELMEKTAKLIEQEGIDAWFDLEISSLIGEEAEDYQKVTDILDVWFDSGVSHFCVLNRRSYLGVPADLYLEGSDQHRGWFQSSLLTALAIYQTPPYKSVLTHGYVVDGKGRKMSKSLGNVIAPEEVVERLGADLLRLWASSTDHTVEINVSDEILSRNSEAYRRIRNTIRFLLSNLYDFDPEKDCVSTEQLLLLDQWAIATTKKLQEKIIKAYGDYQFPLIYQLIHNFCSVEMGSFYLDILKDRLYTSATQGVPRRSAQTALYYIIEALVRWIAPILSYTAEEIWKNMPGKREDSVFLSEWFKRFPERLFSPVEDETWQFLMKIRDAVNKLLEEQRNLGRIGSALDAEVELLLDDKNYKKLFAFKEELRFILITSQVKVSHQLNTSVEGTNTEIPGLAVKIKISGYTKCARCWQRREEVGKMKEHVELCARCVENTVGAGEQRLFA